MEERVKKDLRTRWRKGNAIHSPISDWNQKPKK